MCTKVNPNDIQVMKKEFQKVVKAFRDTLPNVRRIASAGGTKDVRPEYPKAMLTARQAEKRTATINFGCWADETRLGLRVASFKSFPAFCDWCEKYGAKPNGIERDSWGYVSLRIYY